MDQYMPFKLFALATMIGVALCGCASVKTSTPVNPESMQHGLSVVRSLPDQLPAKSAPIASSQYVLLPAESAAGLLMPIPFVSEAIGAALDHVAATSYEGEFNSVDPVGITLDSLRTSPILRTTGGEVTLQPFVAIQECADDRYRLALIYHLSNKDWVGRYTYHLPTAYEGSALKNHDASTLSSIRLELQGGAQVLRGVIERGSRGELTGRGVKVDIGSLHLVCGKAAGMLSPGVVISRDADLIDEAADHVLVRLSGDMTQAASVGGLFFGVHYLRTDQLHTFKKK
jgi:hypothetical protein